MKQEGRVTPHHHLGTSISGHWNFFSLCTCPQMTTKAPEDWFGSYNFVNHQIMMVMYSDHMDTHICIRILVLTEMVVLLGYGFPDCPPSHLTIDPVSPFLASIQLLFAGGLCPNNAEKPVLCTVFLPFIFQLVTCLSTVLELFFYSQLKFCSVL